MSEIRIEREVDKQRLDAMGVNSWPTWSKEQSTFQWHYDESETCFILEGEVVVTPEGGDAVTIGEGDLVTFPKGMSCTWDIRRPLRKHYSFG